MAELRAVGSKKTRIRGKEGTVKVAFIPIEGQIIAVEVDTFIPVCVHLPVTVEIPKGLVHPLSPER